MQFKLLAVSAFAASAFAQASQSENLISVLSVLQTALPSSLVAEALTNSAAVSSQVASEFSAGQTPTWFTALPSDIQTFLVPLATNSAALSSAYASANMTMAPNATAIGGIGHNSTMIGSAQSSIISSIHAANSSMLSKASAAGTTSASATGSSGAGAASASSGSSGSSSSSGSGAVPTAVAGMGLAGAVGLIGLLAL